MITDLEPDILECEVKKVLGSIITNKASEGDGIPVELFQILKEDAVKMPLENSTVENKFGQLAQRKEGQRMFKLLHNCTHLTS